jgi:hypothetical protein
MRYMKLDLAEREELVISLMGMCDFLRKTFTGMSRLYARTRGVDGAFSPVEQVWHLADLEVEGFGARIRRLLTEQAPHLPDLDGDKMALERNYRERSLEEGLQLFMRARRENISLLPLANSPEWFRRGTQEGIGDVTLCDMPSFMLQHDAAHRSEIETWMKTHPLLRKPGAVRQPSPLR